MSHGGGDDERPDLVPMLDTLMLLLIFFILTSKFSSEEKAISSLLPTDKGQMSSAPSKPVEEPKQINIVIFPAGMQRGYQPSEYRDQLLKLRQSGNSIDHATLRVGPDATNVEGRLLSRDQGSERLSQHLLEIHQLIGDSLAKFETGGAERKDQVPVIVHCFSGMSWRFALVAYDAVRYYESTRSTFKYTGNPDELNRMREVTFAPPRIRNYSANELGNELYELLHMK